MYPEKSNGLNRETDSAVYFFTPAFYPLDNFSAHSISLWGIDFPTAEHAFHWKKFSPARPEIAERILTAKSPQLTKEIADSHLADLPSDWFERRISVMEEILRAKTEQHDDVRQVLEKTGNRQIIDNSPIDDFWGIGPNKNGQNTVGKIWMKIRDSLI